MAKQISMFDLRRIPVVKVLIPFAAGAFAGSLVSMPISMVALAVWALSGWICLLVLFLKHGKKPASRSRLFGPWLFLLSFSLGMGSGWVTQPVDPGLPVGEIVLIRGVVKEAPLVRPSYLKCELALQLLYASDTLYPCETSLQVYLYPGTDSVHPRLGEIWQWWGVLSPIRNSGNPGSPDYESIMHRKDCWYRFYPSGSNMQRSLNRRVGRSVPKLGPDYFRHVISDKWQGEEEEVALLKAVCLGDRASLSEDMRQSYGAAGGMHLLAVSGLHVGLIWWVLQGATQWMVRKGKGEMYRILAVLGILWFYASVTAFSSSVCRSVTMFSFFSVGRILGQRTHVLNAIFVSALLLVAIQPSRLMEPGFQLSYAAIIGIVGFYPFFLSLFQLKNRILRWLWQAAAVSLSAQLLTAPLVIYYFHQLPLYSILTSILAIPMLSLLIAVFTSSVPFMIVGILEKAFSDVLTTLAGLMNLTMEAVASMPGALLEELTLNRGMMILILVALILLMMALHGRSRLQAYLVLFTCSVIVLCSAWNLASRRRSSELVLCHFRGASMVIFREGERVDHYCWHQDSVSFTYMETYRSEVWGRSLYQNQLFVVEDSALIKGSVSVCREVAGGAWMVGNDHVGCLVLSRDISLGSGWNPPEIILLTGEPQGLNIEAISRDAPIDLVMDGSNRSRYREKMLDLQPTIHDTEGQGAYVKRW